MNLRQELFKNRDVAYADFQSKLIPNVDREKIIGVRLPVLRKIAKAAAKQNVFPELYYYEELMLFGLITGYADFELKNRIELIDKFVLKIDNWAVCDCACATYKFTEESRPEMWSCILKYKNGGEYEVRFMLVMMLDYFLIDSYVDKVICVISDIRREEYYINMALAWLLSELYVKYKDKALPLIESESLSRAVRNMTIRKICDSRRIDEADKLYLKSIKI